MWGELDWFQTGGVVQKRKLHNYRLSQQFHSGNSTDTGAHWHTSGEIKSTRLQPTLKICTLRFISVPASFQADSFSLVWSDERKRQFNRTRIFEAYIWWPITVHLEEAWHGTTHVQTFECFFLLLFFFALNHPQWDQPKFVLSYILNVRRCLTLWWVVIHPPTSRLRLLLFPHQSDQSRLVLPKRLETAVLQEGIQISHDPKVNERFI